MWAAHFTLEHEEYEAAQEAATGGQQVYLADDESPDDLKNNTVMALF